MAQLDVSVTVLSTNGSPTALYVPFSGDSPIKHIVCMLGNPSPYIATILPRRKRKKESNSPGTGESLNPETGESQTKREEAKRG